MDEIQKTILCKDCKFRKKPSFFGRFFTAKDDDFSVCLHPKSQKRKHSGRVDLVVGYVGTEPNFCAVARMYDDLPNSCGEGAKYFEPIEVTKI